MTMSSDYTIAQNYDPRLYDGVTIKRGVAWVIDVVMIALLCALVLPFTAFTGIFFFPFLMLVVGFIYRWFTLAGASSTWGMRLMGIRLRDLHGAPLSSGLAFAHVLGYTVSMVMAPLQLISVIMMLVTARGQGLTDLLLGTEAIKTDR
ncbi:putative RDD family membrane protein YckC [Yoonia maricola]|uniref:Putative RDD family membrane protein YckC n=1 Tax=Yoonia maricola TaxID=420999 RepID=A0A2M8WMF6_9RHOB|nr:RDD family protein [Yoonia maricola]PJI92114.1 putative RDD family membrane protein YckC [Yoonia maricola]